MTTAELKAKLKTFQTPTIDTRATASRIKSLRQNAGLSVHDIQELFKFEYPVAIYQWESGKTIPCNDNLLTLSKFYEIDISEILVEKTQGS